MRIKCAQIHTNACLGTRFLTRVCSKIVRTFCVCVGRLSLTCTVGSLLFVIYSSKLFNIVNKHLPNVHAYADDTQLYLAFKPGNYANEAAAVSSTQSCLRDVQNWMLMDRLKLNPDKTEFLILGTRQQLEKVITSHLVVGESRISPSTKVKNLGSWFDPNLDMISHINSICSSSFYYLYNIRRIRKYLSHQSAISLIHAFITSKLDYCNSLLYRLPTIHIYLINFKEFKMLLQDF